LLRQAGHGAGVGRGGGEVREFPGIGIVVVEFAAGAALVPLRVPPAGRPQRVAEKRVPFFVWLLGPRSLAGNAAAGYLRYRPATAATSVTSGISLSGYMPK
jgi:hypothetical protein